MDSDNPYQSNQSITNLRSESIWRRLNWRIFFAASTVVVVMWSIVVGLVYRFTDCWIADGGIYVATQSSSSRSDLDIDLTTQIYSCSLEAGVLTLLLAVLVSLFVAYVVLAFMKNR